MQHNPIALNNNELARLKEIICDENYWQAMRVQGYGVPTGVAELKAVVMKSVATTPAVAVQLAAIATRRLTKHDLNRLPSTVNLYEACARLTDPSARDYFKELESGYISFKNYSDAFSDVFDLSKIKSEFVRALKVFNLHHPKGRVEYICQNFLKPFQTSHDYNHSAETSEALRVQLHRPYLKSPLHNRQVLSEHYPQLENEARAYFERRYPRLVSSFTEFVLNCYLKNERLFLNECSNPHSLVGMINWLSTPVFKIECLSANGDRRLFYLDTHAEAKKRVNYLVDAILSKTYFTKLFKDIAQLNEFMGLLDKEFSSAIQKKEYGCMGQVYGSPNFIKGLQVKIKARLQEYDAFHHFAGTVNGIEDRNKVNQIESLSPGSIEKASQAEIYKNWVTLKCFKYSKSPTLFNGMDEGVIKIIARYTGTPKVANGSEAALMAEASSGSQRRLYGA